jgi:integrase
VRAPLETHMSDQERAAAAGTVRVAVFDPVIFEEYRALMVRELGSEIAFRAYLDLVLGRWTSTVLMPSRLVPSCVLFTPSLDSGGTGKFDGSGPPPPAWGVVEPQLIQDNGDRRMPKGERRWCEYWVAKYVQTKRRADGKWKRKTADLLKQLVREGHLGRSRTKTVPPLFRRAGVEPPLTPKDVVEADVAVLREYVAKTYTVQTARGKMGEFRRFLRWAGNPVAEDDELWQLPEGEAVNRRWLTAVDLARLLREARGHERVVIALLGLAALRGVEVERLLVRHVRLDGPQPAILVLGKGRYGGKWRKIPLSSLAADYVKPWVEGGAPDERLVPYSLVTIQKDVSGAGRRAGLEVSAHDLRRTFGRVFVEENGYDVRALLALQKWYGHARLETTIHYLGFDFEEMRAGVEKFDARLRALLADSEIPEPTTGVGETV